MIIFPLCSSSAANSTFIGNLNSGILVDIGCSYKSLRGHLSACNIEISAIKAVLITHEHSDHVKGLFQFSKHNKLPIFASRGTCGALLEKELIYNTDRLYSLDAINNIGLDCRIKAFDTPHDSTQSVGFTMTYQNNYKIAYLTDLGEITPEIKEATLGADFVFIESNYDPELLRNNNKYPQFTKDRIKSKRGHLSNIDSANYILKLVENGTTRIVLAHLSRENNTPKTAYLNTVGKLNSAGFKLNRDYTLDIARVQTTGEYIAV